MPCLTNDTSLCLYTHHVDFTITLYHGDGKLEKSLFIGPDTSENTFGSYLNDYVVDLMNGSFPV